MVFTSLVVSFCGPVVIIWSGSGEWSGPVGARCGSVGVRIGGRWSGGSSGGWCGELCSCVGSLATVGGLVTGRLGGPVALSGGRSVIWCDLVVVAVVRSAWSDCDECRGLGRLVGAGRLVVVRWVAHSFQQIRCTPHAGAKDKDA